MAAYVLAWYTDVTQRQSLATRLAANPIKEHIHIFFSLKIDVISFGICNREMENKTIRTVHFISFHFPDSRTFHINSKVVSSSLRSESFATLTHVTPGNPYENTV